VKSNKKRASIFVYTLILINIALIIWYVVYNNTYIMNNNISIWRNAEEVFAMITDKWNINIESVKQYNWNWWGFTDFISCPTNITMSWTTVRQEWMSSEMYYDYGTVYCYFEYNWEGVRLFFDPETQDYTRVYYDWELRDIDNWVFYDEQVIWDANLNIDLTNTTDWNSGTQSPDRIFDGNDNTQYLSKKSTDPSLALDFDSPKVLSKIKIYKKVNNSPNYWNNWTIRLVLEDWSELVTTVSWVRNDSVVEKNFSYWYFSSWLWVTKIIIEANWYNRFLNITSVEISEWGWTGEERWYIETTFNDDDNTDLYFDSSWVGWDDFIDDNMNSDDYRSSSTWSVAYPWDFIDDDVLPRMTVFSSILPNQEEFFNVYWNNYLTNEFIDNNIFNSDNPIKTVKAWDVTRWNLKFDLFTMDWNLDYDLKIIEFDRDAYKERNTLLPVNVYETYDLSQNYWYLQLNWNTLSLSTYKTWNEFEFNFRDNDYSIYFTNRADENLAIRMTWEEVPSSWDLTEIWRRIYINPINDSYPSTIETMVNHILVWWEKNYIWENFIMVWNK